MSRSNREVYNSTRWRKLREEVLYENPFCVRCEEMGILEPATVCDHALPIEQGGAIWDRNNLQGLCESCHNSKSGKEAHNKYTKVTVITGAPCSGKTTLVKQIVKHGDLVIDIDKIFEALSFQDLYEKDKTLIGIVLDVRDFILNKLKQPNKVKQCYLITTANNKDKLRRLTQGLNVVDIKVMNVDKTTCEKRLQADTERNDKYVHQSNIDRYFGDDCEFF